MDVPKLSMEHDSPLKTERQKKELEQNHRKLLKSFNKIRLNHRATIGFTIDWHFGAVMKNASFLRNIIEWID